MELINAWGTIGVLPQGMFRFVAIWQTFLLPNFSPATKMICDGQARSCCTNCATAEPIPSGLSSWMKCTPGTVISLRFAHVRI